MTNFKSTLLPTKESHTLRLMECVDIWMLNLRHSTIKHKSCLFKVFLDFLVCHFLQKKNILVSIEKFFHYKRFVKSLTVLILHIYHENNFRWVLKIEKTQAFGNVEGKYFSWIKTSWTSSGFWTTFSLSKSPNFTKIVYDF